MAAALCITTIGGEEASARLRHTYDRIVGSHEAADGILLAHSLRPHTLIGDDLRTAPPESAERSGPGNRDIGRLAG